MGSTQEEVTVVSSNCCFQVTLGSETGFSSGEWLTAVAVAYKKIKQI